jgi:multidrug efflux pump subunit AcrA (membrane-fusion protein)
LLLLLFGGAGWWGWRRLQGQQTVAEDEQAAPQPQGIPVRLATIEPTLLANTSRFVGTLEATETVEIRSEVDGTIDRIWVQPGQIVAQGTVLMTISAEQQEAALAVDLAALQGAEASRRSAEAELEALQAERQAEVAEVDFQRQEFERIASLVAEGALESQRLDQVTRDLTQAEANLGTLDRRIQSAQAQLLQAERLVQQNQAQTSLMQERLEDTEVLAPFDGVVGDIPVKVGTYVETADSLTNLVQNQVLELRLPIPLEQAPKLRSGLRVEIEDSQGQALAQGLISFISPQVDTDSQTVLAKATFSNAGGNLRDQQFVRAAVIWEQKANAIVIPASALVLQGQERFVYQVQPGETLTATLTAVQVGTLQGDQAEIIAGLSPGDQIVVSGKQKIFDGATIAPLPDD